MSSGEYYHYSPGIRLRPLGVLGVLLNLVVLIASGMALARMIHIESDLTNWTWIIGISGGIMVVIYLLIVMGEYRSRRAKIASFDADIVYKQATRGLFVYVLAELIFLANATWTYTSSAPYSAIYLNQIIMLFFVGAFYLIVESLFDFTAKGNEDRRIADAERRATSGGM